jgi:hypothetical protein
VRWGVRVGVVVEPQGLEGVDVIGVFERAENGGGAEMTADNAIDLLDPVIALRMVMKTNTVCVKSIPQDAGDSG